MAKVEDEARNAHAAKIQARIRGRKARREAAPRRAAKARERALADKVAALEAENARLRQAASPPSGAKTPSTEDDWEQCVDETTGHTYYYSSSRDLCKNQPLSVSAPRPETSDLILCTGRGRRILV